MNEQSISVRHGEFKVDLFKGGTGKPLLFLHGISGLEWTPFLDQLSAKHTVIAPRTPAVSYTHLRAHETREDRGLGRGGGKKR